MTVNFQTKASTPRQAKWLVDIKAPGFSPRKRAIQLHADLMREAQSVFDTAALEERALTDGEQGRYQQLLKDLDFAAALKAEAEEANERQRALGAAAAAEQNALQGDVSPRRRLEFLQRTPGASGRRYGELFQAGGYDPMGGFKSADEFLTVVASGLADPRILQINAATHLEGVPSQGGYVVPPGISAQWLDASLEDEVVRPRCRVEPMTTASLKVAGFDVSDMSTGAPFGFKAEWADENSEATPQIGKFRAIELHAKKLRIYSEASSELVADGMSFEMQLGEALTKGIGWGLDEALLASGNGAGQPLSVLNDPALITVAKEGGQQPASIVYENITKMFARLHPSAMKGAIWVANSMAIPQLMTLSVPIGTGGAFVPVVKETSGKFSLLGLELVFSEKLPVLGTKGDIILANFQNYTLGLRKEVVLEKSNAPGWTRDVMSYRVILRADGMGRWNKAITPKNGSTQSWCVALATRS